MPNIFQGQSITFDEDGEAPSPTGEFQNGLYTVTIKGWTAWSDVDSFASFLMPVGTYVGGVWGVGLLANTKFRVRTFRWVGFGGVSTANPVSGLSSYQKAYWTITCNVPVGQLPDLSQPLSNADPVPWLIHRWNIGGQYLTNPAQNLVWNTDNATPDGTANSAIFIPTIEHSITWPRLLQPPFANIRAAMSTINVAAVTLSTGVIAAGQGLFLGSELQRENLSDGTLATTLTYKISERPLSGIVGGGSPIALDWNYSYRGGLVGWDRLKIPGSSPAIYTYQTSNFLNLWPTGIY